MHSFYSYFYLFKHYAYQLATGLLNAKQQSTFGMEKCRTWVLPPGLVATLRLIFPVDFVLINLIVCPHVRCFTKLQRQLEMLADK